MDDGTHHPNRGVRLCTNSFTLNETKYLIKVVKENFNINSSIHKTGAVNQYNIYIPKKYLKKLKKEIQPFMCPTMYYKLGQK